MNKAPVEADRQRRRAYRIFHSGASAPSELSPLSPLTMYKPPYDDQTRASALNMLQTAGYPSQRGALIAVSRTTGIPGPTLRRWALALPGDLSPVAPLAGAGPLTPNPSPPAGERGARVVWNTPNPSPKPAAGDIPGAIRAELLATIRSMAAARPEASYKELSAGFGLLAEKLRTLEPAPDGPSNEGPGEAKERLARMVGVDESDQRSATSCPCRGPRLVGDQ